VRGNELVCASYTNGAVVAYIPSQEWDCQRGAMRNPRLLGFFGQQVYRPLSTCVSSDGTIWSVGPAGWGSAGGGIGSISPSGGKAETVAFPDVPLRILPLPRNRLLVCSDSLFRWWDGTANTEIAVARLPVRCVDACLVEEEPSSTVVLAAASELLVADVSIPGTLRIIRRYSSPVPCDRVLARPGRLIICGGKGFAEFDLATGTAIHFCETPPGSRWAIALTGEAVYFSVGSHLMKAVLPRQDR
jgi:hypothetical protein